MRRQLKTLAAVTSAVGKSAGDRRMKFVISDGSVDRENDTINPNGWVLDAFRSNPTVLWAHDHSALPIAKAVEIGVNNGRLEAVAEFAKHPFAQEVYALYRDGFLRAVSVGFRPLEWTRNNERGGIDFKRQELLEFSAVPVPANPQALVAATAAGLSTRQMRAWAKGLLAQDDPIVIEFDADDDVIEVDVEDLRAALRRVAPMIKRARARAIEYHVDQVLRYRRGLPSIYNN